jgi:hypothetical protein
MKHSGGHFKNEWFSNAALLARLLDQECEARVIEVTPHGAQLELFGLTREPSLMEQVYLEFRHPAGDAQFTVLSAILAFSWTEKKTTLRVSFLQITSNRASPPADIENVVFPCSGAMCPQMWADHPWFFNVRLQLRVEAFLQGGARASIHCEGRGLMRDLTMPFQVVIPHFGIFVVEAKVLGVELKQSPNSSGIVYLQWMNPPKTFIDSVALYILMMTPDIEPSSLESAGYKVPDFNFAGVLSYVASPRDLRDVLELRHFAYASRNGSTLDKEGDPEIMRDKYDAHSLIFTVRVGRRLVGTTRLVWNNGDKHKSEIEALCPLPEWIWQKGFVELSRSATLPGLRGRDIFPSLRRHALRAAYQAGYRYILSDCEGHMLKPYLTRGALEMGITFTHPLEGKTLHVLYYDIESLLSGDSGDLSEWSAMWKPMADFLNSPYSIHQ